jgi:ribonuclease VapC
VIVIETSAMVAILEGEPEAQRFFEIIEAEECVVSAVTVYEAAVVINARRGAQGVANLMAFIDASGADIRPFTAEMIDIAVAAYQKYGRGTGAKAKLNLGDCISYALASALDVPLLFKGNDFAATDIRRAL